MKIGVVGAGGLGASLARRLSSLGHVISIANSRGAASLNALAREIGATPLSALEAAGGADVVILSIPTRAVPDLPGGLLANLRSDAVVVDIGNYHPELRDGRIAAIDGGMLESQWVAERLGRAVTKAFNNIFAGSLLEKRACLPEPRAE